LTPIRILQLHEQAEGEADGVERGTKGGQGIRRVEGGEGWCGEEGGGGRRVGGEWAEGGRRVGGGWEESGREEEGELEAPARAETNHARVVEKNGNMQVDTSNRVRELHDTATHQWQCTSRTRS
jgi:hypothetical protein